jgi:hypothetical protein
MAKEEDTTVDAVHEEEERSRSVLQGARSHRVSQFRKKEVGHEVSNTAQKPVLVQKRQYLLNPNSLKYSILQYIWKPNYSQNEASKWGLTFFEQLGEVLFIRYQKTTKSCKKKSTKNRPEFDLVSKQYSCSGMGPTSTESLVFHWIRAQKLGLAIVSIVFFKEIHTV